MDIHSELEKLQRAYKTKVESVSADTNLTPEGKQKAITALTDERKSRIDGMINRLRTQAEESVSRAEKIRLAKIALAKVESEKFDYSRLNYESDLIRSQLTSIGDDPRGVERLFKDVRESQDGYKIRAFIDALPESLISKSVTLIKDIAESKTLLLSPEMLKLETERMRYADDIESIKGDVDLIVYELARPDSSTVESTYSYDSHMQAIRQNRQELTARVFEGVGG